MSKKRIPNFKIGNIKGDVVISNNQSGGLTSTASSQNGKDNFKFFKWFGGIVAFLASFVGILTWLNILPPNSKSDNKSNKADSLTIIGINKENNNRQKDKMIFKKKDNSSKEKKYEIGNVQGDLIISNNQTGGITAHTVVVPAELEIPLKDNFLVEQTTYNGVSAIKISPKQGTWRNSFFAIPKGEMTSKKIKFHGASLVLSDYVDGTIDFSFDDGNAKQTFEFQKWISPQTNAKCAFYLTYEMLPTAIVFGEWEDYSKIYTIRPN